MAHNPNQLYRNVVRVTHVYLGPAAERFISRQVQNHLHKEPEELATNDLVQLIDWIRIAISLITDDGDIIEEYTRQLERLADDNGQVKHYGKKTAYGGN